MAEATKTKKETKKTEKPAEEASALAAPKKASAKKENSTYAVIETGGKQYGVVKGETIKIEKIIGEFKVGDTITFDKVLLSDDKVGAPYISGAKVSGSIAEIGRSKKVIVIKYKQKSRYFKKNGHRQPFFRVTINSIS